MRKCNCLDVWIGDGQDTPQKKKNRERERCIKRMEDFISLTCPSIFAFLFSYKLGGSDEIVYVLLYKYIIYTYLYIYHFIFANFYYLIFFIHAYTFILSPHTE